MPNAKKPGAANSGLPCGDTHFGGKRCTEHTPAPPEAQRFSPQELAERAQRAARDRQAIGNAAARAQTLGSVEAVRQANQYRECARRYEAEARTQPSRLAEALQNLAANFHRRADAMLREVRA